MTWCYTSDKQLPEPVIIQFNDAWMCHQGHKSDCDSFINDQISVNMKAPGGVLGLNWNVLMI